jgi:hypothetical protein
VGIKIHAKYSGSVIMLEFTYSLETKAHIPPKLWFSNTGLQAVIPLKTSI